MPLDPIQLLKELVALPGPPGQEDAVRNAVAAHVESLGCPHATDERGNLIIGMPGTEEVPERADIVVMAHLDEIAMLVERIDEEGNLKVVPLGGLLPWKVGEGPVSILGSRETLTGILGFGGMHTDSPASATVFAREKALPWDLARIFTGKLRRELLAAGVRPGTRVVLGPERRTVTEFGDYIAAPFLDDRADLVAMLLAIESLSSGEGDGSSPPASLLGKGKTIVFAATAAEEVGGHGALYLLRKMQPEVAVALEIGPCVPESPFPIDGRPTAWVNDSYSSVQARDLDLIAAAARDAKTDVLWQALSRGGSDASCAASHGMVARPITLAFAAENSHGYEITHRAAIANLAKLTVAVLNRVVQDWTE